MELIMQCHNTLKRRAPRVLTHITIDDRRDAVDRLRGKIDDVQAVLDQEIRLE